MTGELTLVTPEAVRERKNYVSIYLFGTKVSSAAAVSGKNMPITCWCYMYLLQWTLTDDLTSGSSLPTYSCYGRHFPLSWRWGVVK